MPSSSSRVLVLILALSLACVGPAAAKPAEVAPYGRVRTTYSALC